MAEVLWPAQPSFLFGGGEEKPDSDGSRIILGVAHTVVDIQAVFHQLSRRSVDQFALLYGVHKARITADGT